MSIIAYTGLPGHGKSYSVVENAIIPALKDRRIVAHNLELNTPALSVVVGHPVDQLLVQIPKNDTDAAKLVALCPPGSVIVIDEIWRYWGAGLKASEVPKEQMAFFKEHRHRVGPDGKSSEIVVIDQELGSGVARFIRDLVELTYIHTKMTSIGAKGSFRVDVYSRAQNASKPQKTALIRKMLGKYKPEVWNCYISHTQKSDGIGDAGLEQMPDSRGNLLKSWPVRAAIAAVILIPFLIFQAVANFKSMGGKPQPPRPTTQPQHTTQPVQAVTQQTPQQQSSSLTALQQSPATVRQPSNLWRLVGVVYREDGGQKGEGYALLVSSTGRRILDLKKFCKETRDEGGDYTCDLDGEWVTRWSGSNLGMPGAPTLVPGAAPVNSPAPTPSTPVHPAPASNSTAPA